MITYSTTIIHYCLYGPSNNYQLDLSLAYFSPSPRPAYFPRLLTNKQTNKGFYVTVLHCICFLQFADDYKCRIKVMVSCAASVLVETKNNVYIYYYYNLNLISESSQVSPSSNQTTLLGLVLLVQEKRKQQLDWC